ncbi:MAG: hypothetical protein KBD24_04110 [Candidatus Pacebacteria bacterium]|nr:hypothetical protein [Candidatus Paceibacterota bacterium]
MATTQPAYDESAHTELVACVTSLTIVNRIATESFLYEIVRLAFYKWLVIAFSARDSPRGIFDIATVVGVLKDGGDICNALMCSSSLPGTCSLDSVNNINLSGDGPCRKLAKGRGNHIFP